MLIDILNVFVLLDGVFHLFGFPEFIKRHGPDWVLARGLFDTIGLPIIVHRIMGIVLITMSILYLLHVKHYFIDTVYAMFIIPITLFIVALSILIKNLS